MGRNSQNFHKNRTNFHHGKKNFNQNRFQNNRSKSKDDFFKKDEKQEFFDSLSELEIGVTEYLGKTPGFSAIIKSRYSDFQVNEIGLDGTIVKLTNLEVPKPTSVEVVENLDDTALERKLIEAKLITEDDWQNLVKISKTKAVESLDIDVSEVSKEQRTEIHNTIKSIFEGNIVTSTRTDGDKKFINCKKYNANAKQDRREKWPWPAEYTYFVLHKENIDTMKAAMALAQNLKCRPNGLTYAGTKDKRAKTTQLFCIRKRHPDVIFQAAKRIPNVYVGNFEFREHTLKLGQLKGNRFRIALRNITVDDAIVEESIKNLEEFGFINYYGLQRFGQCATVPTSEVGKALLKGQFDVACELILKPRPNDPDFMKKMREFWWKTRDSNAALKMLHSTNQSIEAKLLAGLAQHGKNDYVSALGNIPRNMRLLYIHAYQSLIFNRVASHRIKTWGLELHEGDLILVDNQNTEMSDNDAVLNVDEDMVDHLIESEADTVTDTETDDTDKEVTIFKGLARPLTKEDISSGQYTIHDVVLPLPGHDIFYPSNETADWYNKFLAEDGLSSEKLKQKVKVYSLTGAYRKLLIRPESFTWSIKTYTSPTDNLITSDLEELNNSKVSHVKFESDGEDGKSKPNEFRALIVEFNLPSSCYATMALREILKIDTSTSSQMKLNHKEDGGKVTIDSTTKTVDDGNDAENKCDDGNKRELNVEDDTDLVSGGDEKRIKIE